MTLFQVITAAVADFSERGYVSPEQLAVWQSRIREAAIAELIPPHKLAETLNRSLATIYERLIEKGGVLAAHPGVSRFTVDKLRPVLRAELNKRIMASADLIKLNREQAVEKTLQRFSGWATSVPAGGSDVVDKNPAKMMMQKSMRQLPFEERRVMIDQGHKLTSSINDVIAKDGGAIAMIWHSQWRQRGYNYRPDHKERDQQVYAIRGNWALEKGLMKKGPAGYSDDITRPAEEPFCLPGDSEIPFADMVQKGYRRWFSGELAEFRTASGKFLRATPNHPVLTPSGWKAVGELNVGDYVIEVADSDISALEENKDDRRKTTISDVFSALQKFGVSQPFDLTAAHFHGDSTNGQVDTITPAGSLGVNWKTGKIESVKQLSLSMTDRCAAASSNIGATLRGVLLSSEGFVGRFRKLLPTLFAYSRHSNRIGVRAGSQFYTSACQSGVDDSAAYAKTFGNGKGTFPPKIITHDPGAVQKNRGFRFKPFTHSQFCKALHNGSPADPEDVNELKHRLPFLTQAAQVVHIDRYAWSGHVFNLQTESGWYVAEGVVTHNCRCSAQYIYNLRALPKSMLTRKGEAELERVRAEIARQVA